MKAITLAVLALALSLSATSQNSDQLLTSFVTSGKFAYYVAPSRLVLDGDQIGMFFSADSRVAIVHGVGPSKQSGEDQLKSLLDPSKAPEKTPWLKVWDTENNAVRDASPAIVRLMTEWDMGFESSFEWSSKPGVAFVAIRLGENGMPSEPATVAVAADTAIKGAAHKSGVFRVNFMDGSVAQVATVSSKDFGLRLMASPTKPLFVITTSDVNTPVDRADLKTTINFESFDLNGRSLKSGHSVVGGMARLDDWTANGADIMGRTARRPSPGKKAQESLLVLNLSTGVVSETRENIPSYREDESEPPITDNLVPMTAKNGTEARVVSTLWLTAQQQGEQPSCMVATDVDEMHWLSPKLNLIAYVSNGRLFASEIVKMDLDEFKKVKAAAEQQRAMNNAKQMAVAMQIYATDCDDLMPLHDGFEDSVYPYVKNRDVMNGFIYTYKGGPLSGLKDPANTEIGYIPVNGGRAVAFADGHVGFQKGP